MFMTRRRREEEEKERKRSRSRDHSVFWSWSSLFVWIHYRTGIFCILFHSVLSSLIDLISISSFNLSFSGKRRRRGWLNIDFCCQTSSSWASRSDWCCQRFFLFRFFFSRTFFFFQCISISCREEKSYLFKSLSQNLSSSSLTSHHFSWFSGDEKTELCFMFRFLLVFFLSSSIYLSSQSFCLMSSLITWTVCIHIFKRGWEASNILK